MGLFSGETKISVFANTCHLCEPENNPIGDAVLYAVLSGQPIASSILNTTNNQMSNLMEKFRKYAEETYSLGLPEVEYESSVILPEQDVIDAIIDDTGSSYGVLLDFHYIIPLVPTSIIAPYLFTARGWDPTTNTITIFPAEFQSDELGRFYYTGSVESIEFNEDFTVATVTYEILKYRIAYTEEFDPEKGFIEVPHRVYLSTDSFVDTQEVPTGLYYGRDYCIASYIVLDSEGSPTEGRHWWYYDISSNKYPALTPERTIDEQNNMLPVVPLRYKNKSMAREEVQDTDLYKTSKVLLKKIGLDFDDIVESLEENPNIDDIDHAYLMFGVDLQTEYVASIRYLIAFFDHIADKATNSVYTQISTLLASSDKSVWESGIAPSNTYVYSTGVEDEYTSTSDSINWTSPDGSVSTMKVVVNESLGSFKEYGLKIFLSYNYIRSEIRKGSIGAIGHATKEWVLNKLPSTMGFRAVLMDDSTLILKEQVTENAYKQITVNGLIHRNVINGKSVRTRLTDVIEDEDEHNLVIPIHYNITKKFPPTVRNQIYQDSLLIVMNSVIETSVAWYATGFFKFIVIVVSVVITIYTGGGGAFLTALSEAAAAGTTALLLFLFETVIVGYAVNQLLNYVATIIGPEAMLIIAVATIALASMSANGIFEISNIAATMPTAGKLMALSCSMLSSTTSGFQQEFEDLQEEYSDTLEEQTALWKELEEVAELLPDPSETALKLLDAQVYSKTLKQPKVDSVENFYNLAIHSGNIGVLSLQGVATYFDLALRLPEADTKLCA